ncbi:methyltransferase domain-containing protein [Patescibacteria group bacterium]|nr:methyltransferase domain-containing protein [Patescibacteria group bacterium]
MTFFNFLKKLPIDLGQKEMRYKSYGRVIALQLAGNGNGKKALDAGCAEGFYTEKLKQQGWNVTAVDKEPRERENQNAQTVDLNRGIPFLDNSFDLVWSTEVIAYLDDPEFFIREIKRVLKPGGTYIITTPNNGFWLDAILRLIGKSLKSLQDQNQKHFFVLSDVKRLFPNESLYGFFPYFLLKFRIKHLIGFLSPTFIVKGTK